MSASIRRAWPLFAIIALALTFHGRILFTSRGAMLWAVDTELYFRWLHQFIRDELLAGRPPLWDPYTYCGNPIAANPQATVFYPMTWLCLVLPVPLAQKAMVVVHAALAGAFMYAYLRRVGIGPAAAIIALLPFAFGGYAMTALTVGHLTKLFTIAWLPLVLYCFERYLAGDGWRFAATTGAALGMQILAGEPQSTYYTIILLTVYALARPPRAALGAPWTLERLTRHALAAIVGLAVVGFVSGTFSAAQLLPTVELARLSDREANSFEFASFQSFQPTSVAEFIIPWESTGRPGWLAHGIYLQVRHSWEFGGYVGLVALVLVACSFAVRGHPALWAARIAALVAIVLMLGAYTPLYKPLVEFLPGLRLFRIPARAMLILQWALCVMSAFGAHWLLECAQQRWRQRTWRIATAAGAVMIAALLIVLANGPGIHRLVRGADSLLSAEATPVRLNDPLLCRPVIACLALAVLVAVSGWLPRNAAIGCLIIFVTADLLMARPVIKLGPDDNNYHATVLELRSLVPTGSHQDEPFRVDAAPSRLDVNAALFARVECVNGYAPMANGRFYRLVHALRGRPRPEHTRHQIAESAYRIADPFPLKLLNVAFATQWNPRTGSYTIVEDRYFMPRAWLCGESVVAARESEAIELMRAATFDPARTVIVESALRAALPKAEGSPGNCSTKRVSPSVLEVRVDAVRDAFLVLSELHYPGWRAYVDGRPAELQGVDAILTGLPIAAGTRRVTYRYEPTSVLVGGVVSLSTVAALGSLAILGRGRTGVSQAVILR